MAVCHFSRIIICRNGSSVRVSEYGLKEIYNAQPVNARCNDGRHSHFDIYIQELSTKPGYGADSCQYPLNYPSFLHVRKDQERSLGYKYFTAANDFIEVSFKL